MRNQTVSRHRSFVAERIARRAVCILAVVLAVGCASTLQYFGKSPELGRDASGRVELPKGPYLVYVAPGEFRVGAEFPADTTGTLVWWPADTPTDVRVAPFTQASGGLQQAAFARLEAGARYGYEVHVNGEKTRSWEFRAGVPAGEAFSFLVVGDTKLGHQCIHDSVLGRMMEKRDPVFYVHTGDFVRYGECFEDWQTFFEMHRDMAARIPMLPVAGNHDLSAAGVFRDLFLLQARNGGPHRYYKARFGDVLVIVLDTNVPFRVDDDQYRFLERTLEEARADQVPHIFVALHAPIFSSGKHGSTPGLQERLQPMLARYGVTAVFSGHDHHYERSKPIDGIVHIVSGGGGADLSAVDPRPHSEKALVTPHFVEIRVDGRQAELTGISAKGRTIDEAMLRQGDGTPLAGVGESERGSGTVRAAPAPADGEGAALPLGASSPR